MQKCKLKSRFSLASQILTFGVLHAMFVGWACAEETVDEVIDIIRRNHGIVECDEGRQHRGMSIRFEAVTGRGFEKEPLYKAIEPGLRVLPRLRNQPDVSIEFQGFGIEDISISDIEDLAGLTDLLIRKTSITDNGFGHLKELKSLRHLDLMDNQIDGSCFLVPGELVELRSLCLREDRVSDHGMVGVAKLIKLSWLVLEDSQVTDLGLEHMKTLTQLRTLSLYQNEIHGKGFGALSALENLRELYVTETLTEEGLNAVRALKTLNGLHVNLMDDLNDISLLGISQLKELTDLEIGYSGDGSQAIGEKALRHLGAMTGLRRLELEGVNIKDDNINSLAGLKNLRTLRLRETQVSMQRANALKKDLPGLKVELVP